VVLFGRSVPFGILLSLVVVLTAFAWVAYFIATWSFTGTAGSNPAPVYHWVAGSGAFADSGAGPGDHMGVYSGGAIDPVQGLSGNVTGITDLSVSYLSATLQNDEAVLPIYACADTSGVPAWAQYERSGGGGGPLSYGPVPAAGTVNVELWRRHAGLVPDQDIATTLPFSIQFDPCP